MVARVGRSDALDLFDRGLAASHEPHDQHGDARDDKERDQVAEPDHRGGDHVQEALHRTVPGVPEARVVDRVRALRDGRAGLVKIDLDRRLGDLLIDVVDLTLDLVDLQLNLVELVLQIGRASCRERV